MNFEELLILEVEKRPILYDWKCKDYKNNIKHRQNWESIVKNIETEYPGVTVEKCQVRWKSLRRRYTEDLKSKLGDKKKKRSVYRNMLRFLTPIIQPIDNVRSFIESDLVDENSEISKGGEENPIEEMFSYEQCNSQLQNAVSFVKLEVDSSQKFMEADNSQSIASGSNSSNGDSSILQTDMPRIHQSSNALEEQKQHDSDDVEIFLMSLAPLLRQFSQAERFSLQFEIHDLIYKKYSKKH